MYATLLTRKAPGVKDFVRLYSQLTNPVIKSTPSLSILDKKEFFSTSQPHSGPHENHTVIWPAEKVLSTGSLLSIPLALAYPHPILDSIMATAIVLHMHLGIESCILDYIRPRYYGLFLYRLSLVALCVITVGTLGGLYYSIYSDIGIANNIRKLWAIN